MADKIIYTLELDDKGFAAVVRNANGEVVQLDKVIKKTGDDGGKSFQGLTATVRDLTVAYAGVKGAVSGVLGILKEYIDLAGDQQGAESRLKFALKQSGDASSETFEKHKELGAELQRLTTVGDETSIKLMGLASQYGVQSDKLGDVAKGAIGLSEAFGVDLEGATKLLSGAMMGEYEMLNRLIPQMRTAKDDTERAAILNKVLANTFDYATERAKGFAGQQKQTQNNINDLKEEIGVLIRTALKPTYVFMNDLSIFMKDHLALSIGIMTGVISTAAIPAFIALGTQLKAIVAEVTLATGGFNLIIPALVAIATATTVYAATMDDSTESTDGNTAATEKNKKAKEELAKTTADLADNTNKLNKLLDEANKSDGEDEKITKARAARDEYFRLTDERIKLLDKELMAKKITGEQWVIEYNKILAAEDVFNQKLSDAYDAVNADKIAKDTEAAAKKLEAQKKLDNEIFAENMAAYNKELAEQKKRIADYAISLNEKNALRLQSEEDAMQAEMDGYLEQYENQKAHDEEMKALTKNLTDYTRTETEKKINDLNYYQSLELAAHKDLLEQKKITQIEFDEWLTASEEKLSRDRQAIYAEYSKDIADILGNSFKDLFVFPDNTEALAQLAEEQDELEETHEARLEAIDKEMKLTETSSDRKIELMKEKMRLEKDYAKQKESLAKKEAELDKDLSDKFIDSTKIAIKSAIDMLAARGAAAAFASALESVPFPFNLVAAPIAYTGAYVAISAAKNLFRKGGYTGDGNRDEEAGIVHKEEFVNTAETVDRVGVPSLQALQDGRATIVPIERVARPESYSGSIDTVINNRMGSTEINVDGSYGTTNRDVVVINNSDFVSVSREVENKRNSNRSVLSNRRINEI